MALRGWVQDGAGMWRHSRWNPKKESLTFKSAQDTILGGIVRKRIMEGLQPLGACVERITKQAEKGFLVGLDGRKMIVRSTHSALNLKLQSTGAILCKTALVYAMEKLEEQGLVVIGDGYKPKTFVELFTFYHDEYQFGVPSSAIEQQEVISVDVSKFDLNNPDKEIAKKEKKAAKEKIAAAASRFIKRQRRLTGKAWARAKIDVKAGTATTIWSPVGQVCIEAFEETGKKFKLDCPITGEYDFGFSWLDTH